MRDNQHINQNIPMSRQNVCWTELPEMSENHRQIRECQHLPALGHNEDLSVQNNSRLSGLPPLPPKRKNYVPPQQRAHLTPHMPQVTNQRPFHNMMNRYAREPHPSKDLCKGEQYASRATKLDVRKPKNFMKTKSADNGQTCGNTQLSHAVVVTEGEEGYGYDINTKLPEDRVAISTADVQQTIHVKQKVATCRPSTTIRSIIQCPDAPLLPGRREPMIPYPPLDPHNSRSHGARHCSAEDKNDQENEGSKLPSISKSKKNIFVCHPPNTPRLTGHTRRKWKQSTVNRNN